jgi:hypothetical protein
VALVGLMAACGGRAVGSREAGALERTYPALRWVPADAAYVAVAARAGDAGMALRHLVELAALAGPIAEEMRAAPLADPAQIGIDPDGSAAVFGQDGRPTAVLPVADPERLARFLGAGQASVTRRGEREVHARGELSWMAVDGWFLIHVGPGLAWADRVGRGESIAADPLLVAAAARGRRGLGGPAARAPGLLGLVRVAAIGADLAGGPSPVMAACAERAATAAPNLVWAADVTSEGAVGWAALDLTAGAARALRAHVAAPAPPGYYEVRGGAPLALDWSIDLAWLDRARAALECPALDQPIQDPVRAATGFAGPLAWHVAARSIDVDALTGEGAAYLVLADPGLIEAQLESIPGRSLFERSRTIAGVKVRVLSVPGLVTIAYRFDGPRFTAAVGDGVMAEVLADRPAPRAIGAELARLHLEPSRLPDLPALLGLVPGGRALARGLARYDEVSLSAHLDGDSVAVFARLRLGRTSERPARVRRAALW